MRLASGPARLAWLFQICLAVALWPATPWVGLVASAHADEIDEVLADQSSIFESFEPRLRKRPSFGLTVSTDIAGVAIAAQSDVRFVLTAVEVSGSRILPPARLAPLWQGLLGKTISLADIRPVLDGIETLYRDNDYYALALVPAQDLSDGRLTIVVYDAFIRDIVVDSDVPNLESRLRPYLDKIRALDPVRISVLERYLLLMADLGGLTLDAKISKVAEQPGAAHLALKFTFDRGETLVRLDNLGNKEVGPARLSGIKRFNDVFGAFEASELLAVTNPFDPSEVVFGRFSQEYELGPAGFYMGFEAAKVWSAPDVGEDDVFANSTIADVYLSYAIIRAQKRNLFGTLAVNFKDVDLDINGDRVVSTRDRWLTASAEFEDTSSPVAILLQADFNQGIDVLGSDTDEAGSRSIVVNGDLSADVTEKTAVKFLFAAQKALAPIPATVRFEAGGEIFGRAFDGGTISGDSGVAASLEISRQVDLGIAAIRAFSLFGFVDYGAVWNEFDESADYASASLGSLGAGFRSVIGDHASLMAYVATPYLAPVSVPDSGSRFIAAFGLRY